MITRGIFDELTRILNHLLAIACHALDVGSMSPIFWLFEEREYIMEFYESISGARMHAALYRPILNNKILPKTQLLPILNFINHLFTSITEVSLILNNNKI